MIKPSRETLTIIAGVAVLIVLGVFSYATGSFKRRAEWLRPSAPGNIVAPGYKPGYTPAPRRTEPATPSYKEQVISLYTYDRLTAPPKELTGSVRQDVVRAFLKTQTGISRPLVIEQGPYEREWSVDVSGLVAAGVFDFSVEASLVDGTTETRDFSIRVYTPPVNPARAELTVAWLEQPVRAEYGSLMNSEKYDAFNDALRSELSRYGDADSGYSYNTDTFRAFKIGVVRGGQFDGFGMFIFMTGECHDMGCGEAWYRVLKKANDERLLLLPEYSAPVIFTEVPLFDEQLPAVTVTDLARPDTFVFRGLTFSKYVYGFFRSSPESWFTDQELVPIAEHPQWGTVYTSPVADDLGESRGTNAFYLRLPDNRVVAYRYEIPFMWSSRIPLITWNDGSENTVDYQVGDMTGCGGTNAFAVRSEGYVQPGDRVIQAGRTNTGSDVYLPKDPNDPELETIYKNFQGYLPEGGERVSYDDFVRRRPIFYWKDPFNRWIRFTRADAFPPAECGKPVIYLYPEKTISVRVVVGLEGTMTASEPAHGASGWSVIAQPTGFVTDRTDGKEYPNLFWEGTGVRYRVPREGFVIKSSDADQWLRGTLGKIGFTDRESVEFREFWVPRMPAAPYSFITFVPQADFDRDAPLYISPKPDVVNRVFMVTRGLDAPIDAKPLPLPRIIRRGFTVVEWGGELRK